MMHTRIHAHTHTGSRACPRPRPRLRPRPHPRPRPRPYTHTHTHTHTQALEPWMIGCYFLSPQFPWNTLHFFPILAAAISLYICYDRLCYVLCVMIGWYLWSYWCGQVFLHYNAVQNGRTRRKDTH